MSSVGRRVQEDELFPRRWTWWRVKAESRRHVFVAAGFVYEPPLHSSLGPCALLAPDTVPDSLSLALSDTYTLLQISFQASRRSVSQPVSSGLGVLLMSGAQSELGRLRPTYQDGDGDGDGNPIGGTQRRQRLAGQIISRPYSLTPKGPGLIADSPAVPSCGC